MQVVYMIKYLPIIIILMACAQDTGVTTKYHQVDNIAELERRCGYHTNYGCTQLYIKPTGMVYCDIYMMPDDFYVTDACADAVYDRLNLFCSKNKSDSVSSSDYDVRLHCKEIF